MHKLQTLQLLQHSKQIWLHAYWLHYDAGRVGLSIQYCESKQDKIFDNIFFTVSQIQILQVSIKDQVLFFL